MVNIRRIKKDFFTDPTFQYIGRAGHGFDGYFGNPLRTIEGYAEWCFDRLKHDSVFRERVRALSGKTLVCFCKPKRCHGDILAAYADALADRTLGPWL